MVRRGSAPTGPAHSPDVTGSVAVQPAPAGHWTWDGGSAITVTQGETIETIARKYGVPVSAIMQANGFRDGAIIRPGQRLVIPRYVAASVAAPAPVATPAPRADEIIHTVAPGETLLHVARHYGVSLTTLARANKIEPYAKIAIGTRLTIPGGRHTAALSEPAPHVAAPRTTTVASNVAGSRSECARRNRRAGCDRERAEDRGSGGRLAVISLAGEGPRHRRLRRQDERRAERRHQSRRTGRHADQGGRRRRRRLCRQ